MRLALWVSSSTNCLFLFFPFYKKWAICLFLIDLQNSLYSLETNFLLAIRTAGVLLGPVSGLSFPFVVPLVAQML